MAILQRSLLRPAIFLLVATTCISCDQATKHVAASVLPGRPPMSLTGGVVRIEYARNPGGFLGLAAGIDAHARLWLLTIATGILLALGTWWLLRRPAASWSSFLAVSLVLAGGFGNLWDRIVRGYVVDFVSIGLGPVRTGIFNVADVAITAGATWLLLAALARSSGGDEACRAGPRGRG